MARRKEDGKTADQFGYTGKILRVDLSSSRTSDLPTLHYADRFVGGKGIGAKIYWDEVGPETGALQPGNKLVFMTGPMGGITRIAGSRWEVCGKSPATIPEQFCYSNLGGSFGAQLKFSGHDGIIVEGKSEHPVYLLVSDGRAEIRDASALWGKTAVEVRAALKAELGQSAKVVAIGPAGENTVVFASMLADDDSSASSGFGAVMGSKNLKAIAVQGRGKVAIARPEEFSELRQYLIWLTEGTSFLQEPKLADAPSISRKKMACFGCMRGCHRSVVETSDEQKGKALCQSAMFYELYARKYYGQDSDVTFKATRLCDAYGVDTQAVATMIAWLARCHRAGILTDENTELPLSKLGSLEYMEGLLRKVSLREGFGAVLARGTIKAAELVGQGSEKLTESLMSTKQGQIIAIGPRLYVIPALLYATEPRAPIQQLLEVLRLSEHWLQFTNGLKGAYISSRIMRDIARRFWGSEIAADFSTYEGKADAAVRIQNRSYANECLIFCNYVWPVMHVRHSDDHVGDPTLESRLLSAVTGRQIDEDGLCAIGERVCNLQRAIMVREGREGREGDQLPEFYFTTPLKQEPYSPECIVPGQDGAVANKKGAVVDRQAFECMKDEYYQLRGWDVSTGLQTKKQLEKIGLADLAADLERRGLLRPEMPSPRR